MQSLTATQAYSKNEAEILAPSASTSGRSKRERECEYSDFQAPPKTSRDDGACSEMEITQEVQSSANMVDIQGNSLFLLFKGYSISSKSCFFFF